MRLGYLAILLHAHLPFVRHPEHDRFLEENWLFEAVAECYLPLLDFMLAWQRDALPVRLTLSLSPTLCAMLNDPLLRERCRRHLGELVGLAEKEVVRTHWDQPRHELASFYHDRFRRLHGQYEQVEGDLVGAFRRLQEAGVLEIITCAATHAVLPLLLQDTSSLRAQIHVACDEYRACFGRDPAGMWLPECAYSPGLDEFLAEANIRWFVLDTHGLLQARPRPRYGVFAPVLTPSGVAAFGRDPASARQVWSREEGYPGDPAYRDFYRDIAFDLDLSYLAPHLAAPEVRAFTGVKYHRITGRHEDKRLYERGRALQTAQTHAAHFLRARLDHLDRLAAIMDQPPLLVAPYDAELFGHWWFEGPEFLDLLVRQAAATPEALRLLTPSDYLHRHPTHLVARPNASTWGEGGHLKVWLNEKNAWLYPPLRAAQERMRSLAARHACAEGLTARFLRQAARELLLAQASDWPFMLSVDTSAQYARRRFTGHLERFEFLAGQLDLEQKDREGLARIESQDNVFPRLDSRVWG